MDDLVIETITAGMTYQLRGNGRTLRVEREDPEEPERVRWMVTLRDDPIVMDLSTLPDAINSAITSLYNNDPDFAANFH